MLRLEPVIRFVNERDIVNFDFLEEILNKSLIENLMVNPKDTPLIFTECAIHNKESRLKLTEFMFEKY